MGFPAEGPTANMFGRELLSLRPPPMRPDPRHASARPARWPDTLPIALSFALAAGCGGGGSGGGPSDGAVSGSMLVLAPNSSVLEAEPNDDVQRAHVLGELTGGQTRVVLGSITDAGTDNFDVFRVTSSQRVSVQLDLVTETQTADLDVYVIDPVSLQFVERFETNAASESGTFM